MAKAVYQRNQKVWVESVGAWAVVEKIEPVWAKGFEEPVRVTYDVGLGRPFMSHELRGEDPVTGDPKVEGPGWRLLRARNKWQSAEDCAHHPYPGTFPVIVTDASDWGGWRVPGAEYDRDPQRIEQQARLIASAPTLRGIIRQLFELISTSPEDAPPGLQELARKAVAVERYLMEIPSAEPAAATIEAAE
ncbi:MAG: hypothetical protein ACHP7N_02615 [Caulobacterales bacterium]